MATVLGGSAAMSVAVGTGRRQRRCESIWCRYLSHMTQVLMRIIVSPLFSPQTFMAFIVAFQYAVGGTWYVQIAEGELPKIGCEEEDIALCECPLGSGTCMHAALIITIWARGIFTSHCFWLKLWHCALTTTREFRLVRVCSAVLEQSDTTPFPQ